jgi:hypothetical protein
LFKRIDAPVGQDDPVHEHFCSDTYFAKLQKNCVHGFRGAMVWRLVVQRRDEAPIRDWRELQDVKNAIVGSEYEAL